MLAAGCGGVPPPQPEAAASVADLSAVYRELAAGGAGRVYELDPAASSVRIYVFRAGLAARAGHNHVLSAPEFSGYFYLPEPDRSFGKARFDLDFPLHKLKVDEPAVRSAAGPAFATVLDDEARRDTLAHMLSADNLDAAHYPDAQIHGLAVAGELPHLVATLTLNLHGTSRTLLVPLQVRRQGEAWSIAGAFALRQSDFGARPYSALGGLLAVEDAVAIEFELAGRPAFTAAPSGSSGTPAPAP